MAWECTVTITRYRRQSGIFEDVPGVSRGISGIFGGITDVQALGEWILARPGGPELVSGPTVRDTTSDTDISASAWNTGRVETGIILSPDRPNYSANLAVTSCIYIPDAVDDPIPRITLTARALSPTQIAVSYTVRGLTTPRPLSKYEPDSSLLAPEATCLPAAYRRQPFGDVRPRTVYDTAICVGDKARAVSVMRGMGSSTASGTKLQEAKRTVSVYVTTFCVTFTVREAPVYPAVPLISLVSVDSVSGKSVKLAPRDFSESSYALPADTEELSTHTPSRILKTESSLLPRVVVYE